MHDIKIYQSSKYDNEKYRLVNYIYYYSIENSCYCLPLVGELDTEDEADTLITLLCDKFWVFNKYFEIIQLGGRKLLFFELCGEIKALVEVSSIISRSVIAIYFREKAIDLLIE